MREIVSMDRQPLTVFAPIDRALSDLLIKARSRTNSLSLVELAKHHIGKSSAPLTINQCQSSAAAAAPAAAALYGRRPPINGSGSNRLN